MARKRKGIIKESVDQLTEMLRRHRGTPLENRIQMLLLLLNDSSLTILDVAHMVQCSERTVRRWWSLYQEGGMEALLSDSSIRISTDEPAQARTNQEPTVSLLAANIREFLNALPLSGDPVTWITTTREVLKRLLGDVDRISIEVNVHCDLHNPGNNNSNMFVAQHFAGEESRNHRTIVTSQLRMKSPGELLLDALRRQKFPLDDFHPPHVFEYYIHEGQTHVGTIFLWREQRKPLISTRTLGAMEELRPFLTFLLTDCIARRRRPEFDLRMFTEIVTVVGRNEGLTVRENEVLLHHLLGREYEEIADRLNISVDTVRKHVKAIHRKSGARTYTELFARYFTPLRET